jgi:hypothetical protein
MPQLGFEPTKPVSERAETVHALDRAATVIGTANLFESHHLKGRITVRRIMYLGNVNWIKMARAS